MLMLPSAVRVYLALEPVDMRRGFDGLSAMVRAQFPDDIFDGHLYCFVSRRRDRMKVLAWSTGGFVLWYKRLERGKFRVPRAEPGQHQVTLTASELAMLIDGIDYSRVQRPPRWEPPRRAA